MKCFHCAKAAAELETKSGHPRLPRGWKRAGQLVVCPTCWESRFALRALTIPIAGPLAKEDWPELREALGKSWGMATQVCNWAVTEMAKADVVRSPGMEKLPPAPRPYLYPAARELWPELSPSSVVALLNMVARRYQASRYERIWLGRRSLESYRYPAPLPIPAQAWTCRYLSEEERAPVIRVRLLERAFELRLRGGPQFGRQLGGFRKLVAGEAIACEMQILRHGLAGAGGHRNGLADRAAGGGQKHQFRLMAKLVAWFPRAEAAGARILRVRTGAEYFWRADLDGNSDPWLLHAGHLRRHILAHQSQLQRLSEDQKWERRRSAQARLPINEFRGRLVKKQTDRLATWCHTAAKLLIGFATRSGVKHLEYDDTERGYLPSFPWHRLQEVVRQKAAADGMECKIASPDVADECSPPAGDDA